MTTMKRITVSFPDEIDAEVDRLRNNGRLEGRSYSQVIRYLVELGLKSESRKQGNGQKS